MKYDASAWLQRATTLPIYAETFVDTGYQWTLKIEARMPQWVQASGNRLIVKGIKRYE